jgi:hypothetical protein
LTLCQAAVVADVIVRATVVRLESDDFPGWVEVVPTDGKGHLHRILEKEPVLTHEDLSTMAVTNCP